MKIVVPVKEVAVLDEEFDLLEDRPGVDPDAIEWELNEWDDFSLEEALQLREAEGEGEVVVVSVGDEEAEEGLRACLAKGADRALRIWDDALEGADPLTVARVLAAVVERESPDLVLCGVQSSDAVQGATGVALAAHLGLPRVAVVKGLDYDAAHRAARSRDVYMPNARPSRRQRQVCSVAASATKTSSRSRVAGRNVCRTGARSGT